MDPYSVLGDVIVKEATTGGPFVVGAGGFGGGGFDSSFLINAAAELAQRGVNTYETGEAEKKSSAATAAQLTKAISADANWASAEAMLDLANQGRDVARIAPAQALQSAAMSNAMSVGSGLPADAAAKRAAAAQEAANKAAQDALSNSKDTLKQATSRAWQKVAQAVASGGGSSGGPLAHFGGKGGGGNWLTKQFGPMKTWQWGLTGVGVVVGAIVVVKLLRR